MDLVYFLFWHKDLSCRPKKSQKKKEIEMNFFDVYSFPTQVENLRNDQI